MWFGSSPSCEKELPRRSRVFTVWRNQCFRSTPTGHISWNGLGHGRCQQRSIPCSEGHHMGIGDCHTTCNFTLVEYQLYIDEVPWLIFSTLADALEKEFEPNFWGTVNYGRKERWGVLEPPWDGKAFGVAPPYTKMRLSIFNEVAHTMRVVQPLVWNHTHLKVHPNGAMVFHEEKRIAFLLPLIVEAHELLPPKPLFWENDDNTIPLWRTTLWLHDETIQWLAETGESYHRN